MAPTKYCLDTVTLPATTHHHRRHHLLARCAQRRRDRYAVGRQSQLPHDDAAVP